MKNLETKIVGDNLVITIPLKAATENSKSGKTNLLASTRGNVPIPGAPADFRLSVNAYFTK